MFCSKCGSQFDDSESVCPDCGTPVARPYPGRPVGSAAPTVPNHMVGAILTTIFCCLIGGIFSLIHASKVNTKLAAGDIAGAQKESKHAQQWIIANVIVGGIVGLLTIVGQLHQ